MRDYRLYLEDILEAVKRIQKYAKGTSLEKLKKDTLVLDGIVRNLEIIGEAAKNIPSKRRAERAEVYELCRERLNAICSNTILYDHDYLRRDISGISEAESKICNCQWDCGQY